MKSINDVIKFLNDFIIECKLEDHCGRCDEARECVKFLEQIKDYDNKKLKSAETLAAMHKLKETYNIPKLAPRFWWCSYCKAYIVFDDQNEIDTHVSMIHGIPIKKKE